MAPTRPGGELTVVLPDVGHPAPTVSATTPSAAQRGQPEPPAALGRLDERPSTGEERPPPARGTSRRTLVAGLRVLPRPDRPTTG